MQETLIGYEAPPGGPSYIGQLAEVAVGTYTELEEIIAPAQAAPGDLVTVEARVKNLHTGAIYIATTGRYNGIDILPTEDYAIVDPGATHSFYFSFTMPNNDASVSIYSFYWTGEEWYQDDSYIDIALKEEIVPNGELVNEVTIQLKNPPNGANKWQIRIVDDVGLKTLVWGADARDNIEEAAVFELSPEWLFPLSVDITVSYQWQEDGEWHSRQLYRAQSIWPYLWDFDKMDWGDEEDPDYREIFIPDLGSYYFDVNTEELYKAIPEVALWPLAIIGGVVVVGVLGLGVVMASAMAKG